LYEVRYKIRDIDTFAALSYVSFAQKCV
jgi:hypothetical protein